MDIVLVYPPSNSLDDYPTLKAQDRNMGVIPPLNLTYVSATIEAMGHAAHVIDANALGLRPEQVAIQIKEIKPKLVGWTVATGMFHQTLDWIRYVKEATGTLQLVGGVHVAMYPEETIFHEAIDYAAKGEAEVFLPPFLEFLDGKRRAEDVVGLVYRDAFGRPVVNADPPGIEDVDAAAFPALHLLPIDKYCSFINKRRNFVAMITTRGCPFKCIFCSAQGKLSLRSAENVLEEIERNYHEFGVREIDFYDTTFTIDKERVVRICQGIRDRGLDILYTVRTRTDLMDEEMLREMKASGCWMIMYGVESSDPEILTVMKKDADVDDAFRTVRMTRRVGISPFGFFIFGAPGETKDSIRRSIDFAKKSGFDYVQFSKMTPFPATPYYDMYKALYGDFYREYVK
ncbi:MAG: B12-binding domain-containing radical SAM protein, partial [Candidatus Methylomirabilis sp.]|nr:B12-binding domain-containing radical SAM protein [Deltaproteobacteria bacterium]